MPLALLGVSHHSAPLDVREKLAFPPERQAQALADLAAQPGVAEAALISTCNRTEVVCRAEDVDAVRAWLRAHADREGVSLEPRLYCHLEEGAVRHLFRVASGLDSMVLGEPQILGQVKQAVKSAEGAGTLGSTLGKLFQHTFSVAKQVRSQTSLGGQSISMSAAALRLAEKLVRRLPRT